MLRSPPAFFWLLALAFAASAAPAQAQTMHPFTGKGYGAETDRMPVQGGTLVQYGLGGKGNPLGEYKATGQHVEDTAQTTITNGQMTITAPGGDQLFLSYEGTIDADGNITAAATLQGGTGQFQGATGSAALSIQDWGLGMLGVGWQGTVTY